MPADAGFKMSGQNIIQSEEKEKFAGWDQLPPEGLKTVRSGMPSIKDKEARKVIADHHYSCDTADILSKGEVGEYLIHAIEYINKLEAKA